MTRAAPAKPSKRGKRSTTVRRGAGSEPWGQPARRQERGESKPLEARADVFCLGVCRGGRAVHGSIFLWTRLRNGVRSCSEFLRAQTVHFAHAGESAANVRNGDRAADDEGHVQRVDDLVAVPAFFTTPNEMIRYAVIAA